MNLDTTALQHLKAASEVLPGNVYPAKGGRKSPGTEYWLVISLTTHGANCIGFDADVRPVSTASYLRSAMRERPVIGRVDVDAIKLELRP